LRRLFPMPNKTKNDKEKAADKIKKEKEV